MVELKRFVPHPIRIACASHSQLVVCGVSNLFSHTCIVLHFFSYALLGQGAGGERPLISVHFSLFLPYIFAPA